MPGSNNHDEPLRTLDQIRFQTDHAREHSVVGWSVAQGARFGLAKRVVLRLARGITAEQTVYNLAVAEALTGLEAQLAETRTELSEVRHQVLTLQTRLATEAATRSHRGESSSDGGAESPANDLPSSPG